MGARLRAQQLKCRTITVQVKDPSLKVVSRQRTLPVPTNQTRQLFREAMGILEGWWPKEAPIRLLSVTASALCREGEEAAAQLSFLQEVPSDDPRQARLERAVDDVRRRFGRSVIAPGTIKPD